MDYGRINNIVLFRADVLDQSTVALWTPKQLHDDPNDVQNPLQPGVVQRGYNIWTGGTNIYRSYGDLASRVLSGQSALTSSHTDAIQGVRDQLDAGTIDSAIINICLQPDTPYRPTAGRPSPPSAYFQYFIDPAQDGSYKGEQVVSAFIAALESERTKVDYGSSLKLVLRHAGEMNEQGAAGDSYAGDPDGFLQTAQMVRQAIDSLGSKIIMSFCPGFNPSTPNLDSVLKYCGDTGHVLFDLVSCTWYLRPQFPGDDSVSVFNKSRDMLAAYFKYFTDSGRSFLYSVDEMGGCDTMVAGNDVMLERMLGSRTAGAPISGGLQDMSVTAFEYATIFLSTAPDVYWGRDARLDFLL